MGEKRNPIELIQICFFNNHDQRSNQPDRGMTQHDRQLQLESQIYNKRTFSLILLQFYTQSLDVDRCSPRARKGAANNQAPDCGRERDFSTRFFCYGTLFSLQIVEG